MNEKAKQIFEILGLEPEEEFKINSSSSFYKLNSNLKLFVAGDRERWFLSDFSIGDIISYGIIKIPQKPRLTNKDKIAIKFLKNCGCHYIARDQDRLLCAYKDKPYKQNDEWDPHGLAMPLFGGGGEKIFDLKISWTDAEPLCLDNFSEDDLKED